MSPSIDKKTIRKRMRNFRQELDFSRYRKLCNTVIERCMELKEFQNASMVHIYVSTINNEVDTLGLIFTLLDKGKCVIVPQCGQNTHKFNNISITSLNELIPSKYGLMEPEYNPERAISPGELDLVIAPLLAFDRSGGRLGFGGGCYDSLLSMCACSKIGLGYSFQEVDSVPMEPHDQRLDIIVTEKEIIRVGK